MIPRIGKLRTAINGERRGVSPPSLKAGPESDRDIRKDDARQDSAGLRRAARRSLLGLLFLLPASAFAGVFPPVPRVPQALAEKAREGAKPAEDEADDPAKLAERIAENTKAAGDKLKNFDTGEETRKTQEEILKDIDKLLNPPPMDNNSGGGGGGGMPPPNSGGMPPPSGGGQGGGGMPPPGGGQGGGMAQGGGQAPPRKSFRERREEELGGTGAKPMPMGQGDKPMPGGAKPMPMGQGDKPMPNSPMGMEPMGNGKPMGGMNPGMGDQGNPSKGAPPGLPLDDTVTKQVWGHLPEKLRQEMNQYYKEQFMPKYGELLRRYYAGLAEREKDKNKR